MNKKIIITYLLLVNCAFAQNTNQGLKMTSTYGSDNKEILDLQRFEGIDFYRIKFSGDELRGKTYKITVKEIWGGKVKSEKTVIDTKDLANAGLDKVGDTTLNMKVMSRVMPNNKLKVSFMFDRFSNTKEYKALKTNDYSLRNLADESKLPIGYGEKFYFMASILPYERADGSKSWCEVGSNGKDIENWGKKFGVKHYLLFEMKFE